MMYCIERLFRPHHKGMDLSVDPIGFSDPFLVDFDDRQRRVFSGFIWCCRRCFLQRHFLYRVNNMPLQ